VSVQQNIDLFLTAITIIFGVITTLFRFRSQRQEKKETEKKTSEKFEELSNLLKTASSKIKEMENEIEDKRHKVKELEKLRKELGALVSLREDQVTAIRTEFKSIMDASARRNRIWTIIMGAFWFIIGLFVRGFLGF